MSLRSLDGFVVGITADRRWREQAELLDRRGATIVHGPTMATQYLASDQDLQRATLALIQHPPDYLVATTGIGVRAWMEAAACWGLNDNLMRALSRCRTVARGPKAAAALLAAGITAGEQSGNEQMDEVLKLLLARPLTGLRVAVQEYGEVNPAFMEALAGAGATVVPIPVYRWHLPEDPRPAIRLVEAACERRVDALTFTSAPAVRNLFAIAAEQGLADALRLALNGGVAAVCVGPVCAASARRVGIEFPPAPTVGRMGLMVRSLIDHLAARRRVFSFSGADMVVQGSAVEVDGSRCQLTAKQRDLFEALVDRPGAVVSRAALLTRVWGAEGADPHALEVTVGRLRRRLGGCGAALRVMPGRGYRLDVEERAGRSYEVADAFPRPPGTGDRGPVEESC